MKRIEPKLDFSLKNNTYDNIVLGICSNILFYGSNLINLIRRTATHENQDLYQSQRHTQAHLSSKINCQLGCTSACGKTLLSPEFQVSQKAKSFISRISYTARAMI